MKFHNHPKMETELGVDEDHVIIDRDLFEALLKEWAIDNEPRECFCGMDCGLKWCPGAY